MAGTVRSNNKPKIPARYYLASAMRNMGCPVLLRTDCRTENGVMAVMQCYFCQDGINEFSGEKAHKYGSSLANQQVIFQKQARRLVDRLIFKDIAESGVLNILQHLAYVVHVVLF